MSATRHSMLGPDSEMIDELLLEQVDDGSRVIDLGCGDGRLMERLRTERGCRVMGVELGEAEVTAVIGRGLSVIRADLDQGLGDIPDDSFDSAVSSQTLQQVHHPTAVLREMLRVARRALVVVPNFGHWRIRLKVIQQGRAPVTDSLPYEWYDTPNLHVCSMHDIRDLVNQLGVTVVREIPIIGGRPVERAWWANLRADSALFVLERASQ